MRRMVVKVIEDRRSCGKALRGAYRSAGAGEAGTEAIPATPHAPPLVIEAAGRNAQTSKCRWSGDLVNGDGDLRRRT